MPSLRGGGEAPDEARHSLDLFVQATAGRLAKQSHSGIEIATSL
jgi:hypothetical protein